MPGKLVAGPVARAKEQAQAVRTGRGFELDGRVAAGYETLKNAGDIASHGTMDLYLPTGME